MRALVTTSMLALSFAQLGFAQSTGNPAGMAPDTSGAREGTPPVEHTNAPDQLFAREAAIGGRAEVEISNLEHAKQLQAQLAQGTNEPRQAVNEE